MISKYEHKFNEWKERWNRDKKEENKNKLKAPLLKLLDLNEEYKRSWRSVGWTQHYKDWDKKLWSGPYDKVIQFLLERRASTIDPSEYYCTLPYLINERTDSEFELTFEDFQQGTSNHTSLEKSTHLDTLLYPVEPYLNTI